MESNNHIQFCIKDTYSYYFRIKTPAKFKKLYPGFKKEIKKSLRTSSPYEARKLSSLWYTQLSAYFDAIYLNNQTIDYEIVINHISQILDLAIRNKRFNNINNGLNIKMSTFDGKIRPFTIKMKDNKVDSLELEGDTPEERDEDVKRLAAFVNLLNSTDTPTVQHDIQAEVEQPKPSSDPSPYNQAVLQSNSKLRNAKLSELIEVFLVEDKGKSNKDTQIQKANRFDTILKIIGDRPCSELTNQDAKEFLDKIQQLPARMDKRIYRGLSIDKILEIATDPIAPKTIEAYVVLFKRMCKFGSSINDIDPNQKNYLGNNIAASINYDFDKKTQTKSYVPFTSTELEQLFKVDFVYGNNKENKTKFATWMFWMPLLGLYTGGRVSELAQLYVDDIKLQIPARHIADPHTEIPYTKVTPTDIGIWFISINDEEEKKTKTNAGIRRVPIHPDLISLGFLDFVKDERFGNFKNMLFSDFTKTQVNENDCGGQVSKWFNGNYGRNSSNGLKQAIGLETKSQKVFHSFRKSFARNLRAHDVPVELIGAAIGHETLKIADGSQITLGYTGDYPLENLQVAVNKLDFGIDISHVDYQEFLKMYSKQYKKLIREQKREDRNL
jgi:integrase